MFDDVEATGIIPIIPIIMSTRKENKYLTFHLEETSKAIPFI
jgi:hypothetical protein